MLQIHGGADVRGGYTAPHIFAFNDRHDIDEFFLADPDYSVDIGDEQWYTDNNGYHWYSEGSSSRSLDQHGFVNHIMEYIEMPEEDVDIEFSRKFPGDLMGCSINKSVVGRKTNDWNEPAGRKMPSYPLTRTSHQGNDRSVGSQWLREDRQRQKRARSGDRPYQDAATGLANMTAGRKISGHKVLAIYDNGGQTADRYAIYVTPKECLVLSNDCNMPNGVNMWGSGELGDHNGKKISFEDLPEKVQRCVEARLRGS